MSSRCTLYFPIVTCLAGLLLSGCSGTVSTGASSTPTSPASPIPSHLVEPVEVISVIGPEQLINPGGPSVTITLKCISDEPIISLRATLELNRSYDFNFPASVSRPFSKGDTSARGMTLINAGFSDEVSYSLTISGIFQDGWTFSFTKYVYITPRSE